MSKTIFISACEPSADAHCANLITAVKQKGYDNPDDTPGITWIGVAGQKTAAAGCDLLEDTVAHAAMIHNVFGEIGFYFKVIRRISAYFKSNNVDLVVVCDSPAFNFHVARAAKKAGIKVLWYVAPQLWAWAPWRINKLRRRCDKLACILPFEKEWFKRRDMDAEFVGNPLFDDISLDLSESYKDYSDYDPTAARIALLPGSRKAEIQTLWPAMQEVAVSIKEKHPNTKFLVSAANDEKLQLIKEKQVKDFNCEYFLCDVAKVTKRSDLAIVASGSATLQVAAAGCPMVVMYQSSRIIWHLLGKYLIKTRFLSLVNILAQRELVTEFMPYFTSTEPIFQRCAKLLSSPAGLGQISRDLVNLVTPMKRFNASKRLAEIAMDMLD